MDFTDMYNSLGKKGYQRKVIDYMVTNGSITSMDAFREMNHTRLAVTIKDLRDKGFDIETKKEVSPIGKRYGRYVLHK